MVSWGLLPFPGVLRARTVQIHSTWAAENVSLLPEKQFLLTCFLSSVFWFVPGFRAWPEVWRFILLSCAFICVFPLLSKLHFVHDYLTSIIYQLISIIPQTQLCLRTPGSSRLWGWFLGSRRQAQHSLKAPSSSPTRWKRQADRRVPQPTCTARNRAPEEAGAHGSQQDYDCSAGGVAGVGVWHLLKQWVKQQVLSLNEKQACRPLEAGIPQRCPCGRGSEPLRPPAAATPAPPLALVVARVWCQVSEWKRHCKISQHYTHTKIPFSLSVRQ